MTKPIKAKGLASVSIKPHGAESVILVLSDISNKHTGYLINPDGLNALLVPALELAAQWADQPDLQVRTLTGPHHALPAHHISIEQGRTDKESAVRIFVGKLELTFLVPLDSVINATAQMVKQINPNSGKPPH